MSWVVYSNKGYPFKDLSLYYKYSVHILPSSAHVWIKPLLVMVHHVHAHVMYIQEEQNVLWQQTNHSGMWLQWIWSAFYWLLIARRSTVLSWFTDTNQHPLNNYCSLMEVVLIATSSSGLKIYLSSWHKLLLMHDMDSDTHTHTHTHTSHLIH